METQMMCMSHYEMKPCVYEKFVEEKECIRTNGMLVNIFVYLYQASQFNVMNASTTC